MFNDRVGSDAKDLGEIPTLSPEGVLNIRRVLKICDFRQITIK